jgi:putative RNA 2'-phosphotransferase
MEGNLDLTKLSRTVSHALRHEPWLYGLELDRYGWVHLIDLVVSLRLAENDIIRMISKSDKHRFEIYKGKIRALYGHSLPGKVLKMSVQPPAILFHGTSSRFIKQIKLEGLKPMGRHYVHLSVDRETALLVAKRKHGISFIITVQASKAYRNGIEFYQGNKTSANRLRATRLPKCQDESVRCGDFAVLRSCEGTIAALSVSFRFLFNNLISFSHDPNQVCSKVSIFQYARNYRIYCTWICRLLFSLETVWHFTACKIHDKSMKPCFYKQIRILDCLPSQTI